jgi:DNA-binding NtrC family response regulator
VVNNESIKLMARILIVDDDADLLNLMGEYLESAGLEHDLAVSAEQARNFLKRSRYDMVVSDYNMPGESGLDLLRYTSFMYPKTPFILWSGHDDPRIKHESMRFGVYAYVQRPFYMAELRRIIISLLRCCDPNEVTAA